MPGMVICECFSHRWPLWKNWSHWMNILKLLLLRTWLRWVMFLTSIFVFESTVHGSKHTTTTTTHTHKRGRVKFWGRVRSVWWWWWLGGWRVETIPWSRIVFLEEVRFWLCFGCFPGIFGHCLCNSCHCKTGFSVQNSKRVCFPFKTSGVGWQSENNLTKKVPQITKSTAKNCFFFEQNGII